MSHYLCDDSTGGVGGGGYGAPIATFDPRVLTPTSIVGTGITTVDGIDLDVTGLGGATSIEIDASGIVPVGGSALAAINIDLATLAGAEDLSAERGIAVVLQLASDGNEICAFIGQSMTERVGGGRFSGTQMVAVAVRGGGSSQTLGSAVGAVRTMAIEVRGRTGSTSWDTAALTGTPPLVTAGPTHSGPGTAWVFTGAGGILRIYWTGASSRVAIEVVHVYRIPFS